MPSSLLSSSNMERQHGQEVGPADSSTEAHAGFTAGKLLAGLGGQQRECGDTQSPPARTPSQTVRCPGTKEVAGRRAGREGRWCY